MSLSKKHPSLSKSFGYATRGIVTAVKGERNLKLHLVAALTVMALGLLLQLVIWEWVAILFCCALVLATELMNTAVETVVDLVSPDYNELAGRAKDIAAAAVWITAIFAAVIGTLVFVHAARRMAG